MNRTLSLMNARNLDRCDKAIREAFNFQGIFYSREMKKNNGKIMYENTCVYFFSNGRN